MHRLPWLDRKFQFDIPSGWLYNVSARLVGTQSRLESLVLDLTDEKSNFKPDDKWSIKEHIGHLSDLEDLHLQRLSDFAAHRLQLSTWDVTNAATEQANHNDRFVKDLIEDFGRKRKRFVETLMAFDDSTHAFQSMHPRLKIPMKPVDMATFVAEHDDHHIASMISLKQYSNA